MRHYHRVLLLLGGIGGLWQGPARAFEESSPQGILTQAYDASRAAKTDEQFTAVIAQCQQGLDAAPDEPSRSYARQLMAWALNKRGELRVEKGRDDEALADFQKSLQLNPQGWRALNNRAVSYATAGRATEAFADFDRVLQLKPDFAAAWFNRATLRMQKGDLSGAVQDYSQAHKLKPADPSVLVGRAQAYRSQGELDAALVDLNHALRLDAQCLEALVERAELHMRQGRYAEAAADARAAVKLDAQSAAAYRVSAWLMATCADERFRDRKLAIEAASKALELSGEEDYRCLEALAAAYASAEQFDHAVVTQKKALARLGEDRSAAAQAVRRRLEAYQKHMPYRESYQAQTARPAVRTSR